MTDTLTLRPPAKYRHEHKFTIDFMNYLALSQKLRVIMQPDTHADENGRYLITSLYFDNCFDKALKEKLHGVAMREKFRLRYYGDCSESSPDIVFLEKKQKINGLCLKHSVPLLREECVRIIEGDWQWLKDSDKPLAAELGFKMQTQLLRPRSVVRYVREPYVYEPGNVRITFDSEISTGLSPDWFFEPSPAPLTDGTMILEVKYDEFLPENIRHIVQPHCTRLQAFSKYAACRSMA